MNTIKSIFKAFMHGPIYVVIFGMIFFCIGGGLAYRQYTFEQKGIQVQGEVTGHTIGSCDDDGCSYKSVVSFKTQNGKSISFPSNYSSSPPAYDVGETVTVFYTPDSSEKAIIQGEGRVFRIVFMSVGGVIILFGLSIFASNLRKSSLTEAWNNCLQGWEQNYKKRCQGNHLKDPKKARLQVNPVNGFIHWFKLLRGIVLRIGIMRSSCNNL